SHGPLTADRPADVVDDEVAALDPERVDRLAGPPSEPRPRVVEALGTVGEAEPGEVECNRPQPLIGDRRDHLPIEERARWNPVEQHDRRAPPLLANEARHAAGLEAASGGPVDLDRLAGGVGWPHAPTVLTHPARRDR